MLLESNRPAVLTAGHFPGTITFAMTQQPVLSTDIQGVPKFVTGKVRDVYDLGDAILLVATDRISAFDVVLPTGIPGKGRVLTQMSLFWFDLTKDIVPNHLLATDLASIEQRLREAGAQNLTPELLAMLDGRSLLVKKCKAFPMECVVRGYISGSAWKDYQSLFAHGGEVKLYGIPVPVGLRESDRFPSPIFTPATKAQSGHDENISQTEAAQLVGTDAYEDLKAKSVALYTRASEYAAERGIIIADTKFEFGVLNGEIILIDEALTPDSSRFWEADSYKPGRAQQSLDKQFVRDYLLTLDWDRTPPGPVLPDEIVEKTVGRYHDAYRRLTGRDL